MVLGNQCTLLQLQPTAEAKMKWRECSENPAGNVRLAAKLAPFLQLSAQIDF